LSSERIPYKDIDDVIQEAYAALASLHSVAHIRTPRAYFFQTVKSIILQSIRRAHIVQFDQLAEADSLQIPSEEPSPERVLFGRHDLKRASDLIKQLPPQCRAVFRLRKIEGLTGRQIAARLGIAESTVEKHLAKGLRLFLDAWANPLTKVTPFDSLSISRNEPIDHAAEQHHRNGKRH
jgi:RNA polymerase sigma-70 factor (ECF subfamily)